MSTAPDPEVVDLGGCDGCGLGCAVACASSGTTADEARRVLAASGLGLLLLALVPALIAVGTWIRVLGSVVALAGMLVAGLALRALVLGRPSGDPAARAAYRVVPVAVAGVLVVWAGALLSWWLA